MQRPLKRLQSLCDHSGTKNLSSWQTWPNLIVSTLLCHAFFMAIRTASSFLMAGAASTISTGGTSFQCGYSRAASVRSLDHQSFTVCEFLNHQNLGCSQLRNLCLCSCNLNFYSGGCNIVFSIPFDHIIPWNAFDHILWWGLQSLRQILLMRGSARFACAARCAQPMLGSWAYGFRCRLDAGGWPEGQEK